MDDSLIIILLLAMISWSIYFANRGIIERLDKIERRLNKIADDTES